ncbi:MAG: hypothetical protein A2720_01245 [Candidatus Doudnabacteria bacterium RIFCSPHIGHO2_01_FULL_46_24]|uniref:DUF8128 domain-containing protein n=1 Tax=Candidatus Doudnabacteria bacterium RIFCSPHIGHO2_01_FULL_46_24 TaxID=1817825 RepID=A0A1F5NU08_9BACT|nr:MAG: hypothetical protein A2720_01245 [Candidatus Doudnabacteria bacterium RIFCSPHIGHO2_01_FULL_46_24]
MIQALRDLFSFAVDYGLVPFGWVFFLGLLLWMWYKLTTIKNNTAYINSIEWIFLELKIHDLNERSSLAMEQVFAALHAIHTNYSFGETLFGGKSVLWLSCEIVSLGGKVSYIFKIPKRYRALLESAIFAQYPRAEISETEDYLRNMPHEYYPQSADFEFWGTQLNKKKDNAYPIRLIMGFEHKEQETFIDPVSNIIEVMSNIQPWELLAYQLCIQPINDDWKKNTKYLLDELKGARSEHKNGWFNSVISIPRYFMDILVHDIMGVEAEVEQQHVKEEPPTLMLHKSDVEKKIIADVENALGKIYYKFKLRLLYLAPKDKFNRSLRVPEIIGAFRNFDDVNLNGLKPDIAHTWTNPDYKLSPTLEAPALRHQTLVRKRHMWHYFLGRKIWQGTGENYMNTEELATVFHFPVAPNVRVSQLEKVQAVKSAPPADLPIG